MVYLDPFCFCFAGQLAIALPLVLQKLHLGMFDAPGFSIIVDKNFVRDVVGLISIYHEVEICVMELGKAFVSPKSEAH